MQQDRHSQQAWIIWQQVLSPLVQVMQQPSLVNSHLHMPQIKLHWQTVMPFIVQQQVQVPPASILHKFCKAPQATSSSQEQVIFIPPVHFSNFISQRGKTHQFWPTGIPVICVPIPGMLVLGNITLLRSIIIALDIFELLSLVGHAENQPERRARKCAFGGLRPWVLCAPLVLTSQNANSENAPPAIGVSLHCKNRNTFLDF